MILENLRIFLYHFFVAEYYLDSEENILYSP